MIQRTLPARLIRLAIVIQRQRDPDLQKTGGNHPGQRPEPMPRDLIFLRPPAQRQTQADAILVRRLEMSQQGPGSPPPAWICTCGT